MTQQPKPQGASFGPSHQIEMKEKLSTLMQDLLVRKQQEPQPLNDDASTFHTFAQSDAASVGGRFAQTQSAKVVGADKSVEYPAIPSGPWSAPDPSGLEPPFPVDVSEPVITGEWHEVQASLASGSPLPEAGGTDGDSQDDPSLIESPSGTLRRRKI
jgi:hypothetical protein